MRAKQNRFQEAGAALVENALLVALISVAVVTAVDVLAAKIYCNFDRIQDELDGDENPPPVLGLCLYWKESGDETAYRAIRDSMKNGEL